MIKRYLIILSIISSIYTTIHAHGDSHVLIDKINVQLEQEPNNPELYFNRAVLFQENGHFNEAFLDYHKVKELEPSNTFVDLNLARLCYENDFYELALNYIQSYIVDNPESIKGLVTRGQIFQKLEQFDESKNDFIFAINSSESKPEYYNYLANVLIESSSANIDEAIKYYKLGQSKIGQLSTFSESIIELELLHGDFESALIETELLIQQSNRKESWYLLKGNILKKAGRIEEAKTAYMDAKASIDKLSAPKKNTDYVKNMILEIESALTQLF